MPRTDQKERTRSAIVDATRSLITQGAAVSMPAVAKSARVSEATAYRYFPRLSVLLQEAEQGRWPTPEQALQHVADAPPADRVAAATEVLLRGALANEGVVRAMIAATVQRPEAALEDRPGRRFGLIDEALRTSTLPPERLEQLKLDLTVVMSVEALFTLMDMRGLDADAAVASLVRTTRTLTLAALAGI